MSEIKRFLMTAESNKEILDSIKTIGDNKTKLVEYANSKGFKFSMKDLEDHIQNSSELSDEQLDKVAGGVFLVKAIIVG